MMPVTSDDVAGEFTSGEIGAGMRACALCDHKTIRIGQVKDSQFVGACGNKLGAARRTIFNGDQSDPTVREDGPVVRAVTHYLTTWDVQRSG
ncbi:MAG TPA: hypothetical protein VMV94_15675 [Phycisphaerae bacterium]|nr:hypothetical protein [Phycisphaerae bacterium]